MYKLYKNIVGLLKQIKFSLCPRSNEKTEGYVPTTGLLVELLEAIGDYSAEEIKFSFSYCGKRKTFSVHVRDKDDIPSTFTLNDSSQIELTQHNINMAILWVWETRQALESLS